MIELMLQTKSPASRRKALEDYLTPRGMSFTDYERIEREASEPFYRNEGGLIVIPENHVMSFLVATCDESRAANRPCQPNQVRSRFIVTPWKTDKAERDGVWERFATVSAGTGAKLSNQRGLRSSQYIEKFSAVGTISFDDSFVKSETLCRAIEWGGMFVGIGASRKMGWGRFTVTFADASLKRAS